MSDLEIYKKAASILEMGENVALVTVISTTGSTPGKMGYKMLVWGEHGQTIGTVGGGLIEAEIIDKALKILPNVESRVFRFNLDGTENAEGGICGGSIELLIETFDEKNLPLFRQILTAIENGGRGALVSVISPDKSPVKILIKDVDEARMASDVHFSPEIIESIRKVVAKEQCAKKILENGTEIFIESICEQPMLFIFGGGHLSYYISRYAKSLDFRITICEDRAEFANQERFPDADNIVVEDFENVFDKVDINNNSFVVIVTRAHKCDEIVLEKAVSTDAKYIGMIGSKRKTLTILRRLQEKGIPKEALGRVYSPIGISIGAVTPQEIALSIVCELTKIRRLGDAPDTKHMTISRSNGAQDS
jgi:xanthine dehydrogenase accessory factor